MSVLDPHIPNPFQPQTILPLSTFPLGPPSLPPASNCFFKINTSTLHPTPFVSPRSSLLSHLALTSFLPLSFKSSEAATIPTVHSKEPRKKQSNFPQPIPPKPPYRTTDPSITSAKGTVDVSRSLPSQHAAEPNNQNRLSNSFPLPFSLPSSQPLLRSLPSVQNVTRLRAGAWHVG